MKTLNEQELRAIEGGIIDGGCIPSIPGQPHFPYSKPY